MKIEFVDHPADIGFRVWGHDIEEAYCNAGRALCMLLATPRTRKTSIEKTIEVRSEDLHALTYDFLEQLLVLYEVERFMTNDIHASIQECEEGYVLEATLLGAPVDECGAEPNYDVKAITYHMMEVAHTDEGWRIQVIVDI
jgi:SHS2 domain-containing protein